MSNTLKDLSESCNFPDQGLPRMPIPSINWSEIVKVPATFPTIESDVKKPILGLVPRFIRVEQRIREINDAIDRHTRNAEPIPQEWIDEYNEHAEWLIKHRNKQHG